VFLLPKFHFHDGVLASKVPFSWWCSCFQSSIFTIVFLLVMLHQGHSHDGTLASKGVGQEHPVVRVSDWKARQSTDVGSSPWCSKGFFSKSQLPVKTLIQCLCALTCINIWAHVKNPKHWQSSVIIIWTHENRTHENTSHTDRNG